jgi:SAM-dependent methyltransferase
MDGQSSRLAGIELAPLVGWSLPALLAFALVLGCQTDREASLGSRSEPAAGGSAHPLPVADPTPAKPAELAAATPAELAASGPTEPEPRRPDVLYVPTPQDVVEAMLVLARVGKDDVVYDLGCGDGRIVVTAAERYGARAVGYDIDPERVREARQNVAAHHVEPLVSIEQRDIFTLDLSTASVVALYLLPELNVKLLPQLERMKPGSRIVSHDFDIAGVVPTKVLRLGADHKGVAHSVYFYELPLIKEP